MPMKFDLRPVTREEERALRSLAASRTRPVRLVQRATLPVTMLDDPTVSASVTGRRADLIGPSGCAWVTRFNAGELDDLANAPRGGHPPIHAPEVRSKLIDLAIQEPSSRERPFDLWPRERRQREFEECEGGHRSDSTIWTWLRDEALPWKRQQSWFHDPEFVEKRGPSFGCIPRHQVAVA